MKMAFSVFVLGLVLSSPGWADEWITCKVRYEADDASRIFEPFDGGELHLNTADGTASLSKVTADGQTLTMPLVDQKLVSSYRADRGTCEYNPSVSHAADGTLESFFIAFGSCHLPRPDGSGLLAVVSTSEFYDAKGNRGLYQESHWDNVTAIQPYFWFGDCRPE